MLNMSSILIFSEDPKALSAFYGKVFGKEPEVMEGDYHGYQLGAAFLVIGPHDRVKGANPNPERILVNFETAAVKAEFERIRGLGAGVVAEPYRMSEENEFWIATFADPDGNFFQLMSPRVEGM
jgi:predicted enzyme related to lactoylglutathione lyase